MRPSSPSRLLRALLAAALLAGCGYVSAYRAGFEGPEGVRLIAVPVFANHTWPYRRGIEFDLTEAVTHEILARTSIAIAGREVADAILEAEITDYKEYVIAEDARDEVTSAAIQLTMKVTLRDRRTGKPIVKESVVQDQQVFSAGAGETEEQARERAFRKLAARVVFLLEKPW